MPIRHDWTIVSARVLWKLALWIGKSPLQLKITSSNYPLLYHSPEEKKNIYGNFSELGIYARYNEQSASNPVMSIIGVDSERSHCVGSNSAITHQLNAWRNSPYICKLAQIRDLGWTYFVPLAGCFFFFVELLKHVISQVSILSLRSGSEKETALNPFESKHSPCLLHSTQSVCLR